MKRLLVLVLIYFSYATFAEAAIKTEIIEYKHNDTKTDWQMISYSNAVPCL